MEGRSLGRRQESEETRKWEFTRKQLASRATHPWALFIKRTNFALTLQIVLALFDVVSESDQWHASESVAARRALVSFLRSRRVSVTPRRVTEWPSSPI